MRQGNASRDVMEGGKREPRPHGINVKGVSQIGETLGNKIMDRTKRLNPTEPLKLGPGYKASMAGRSVMRSGSQGRHED